MDIFYVYVAFRPWDGSPCYVGKGKGRRSRNHARKSHNRRLQSIINKAGGEIPVVIVRSGISETFAFEVEMALIKAIGRNKNGPLVNMTDGGEGVSGHKMAPEIIARIAESQKGNTNRLGIKATAETRRRSPNREQHRANR